MDELSLSGGPMMSPDELHERKQQLERKRQRERKLADKKKKKDKDAE
jgi:hypothetical protein